MRDKPGPGVDEDEKLHMNEVLYKDEGYKSLYGWMRRCIKKYCIRMKDELGLVWMRMRR